MAWSGQLRHLPPPVAGIMALMNRKRLGYSQTSIMDFFQFSWHMPGVGSRTVPPSDNTAWQINFMFQSAGNEPGGHVCMDTWRMLRESNM